MLKSRLFLQILIGLFGVVAVLSATLWAFTVPLVERKAYDIELAASRTILDNVFEMASKMAGGLDETRGNTEAAYRERLRSAVALAVALIESVAARRARGEIDEAEFRRLAFDGLGSVDWGGGSYVWVSDYAADILAHPDPRWRGRNVAAIKDESGEGIVPRVIEMARKTHEGSTVYAWTPLGSGRPARKLACFRDLPDLGIVVGAGAWLDDIDAEVDRRRVAAIEDMRRALREIRIARTGYAYVFDAADRMIIHPNSNIEGSEFAARSDPKSGAPIADELKAVADTDRPLHYMWDKPSDPGNYVYEKISWVRHFREFDWYIASSVYVDELKSSSEELSRRILGVTVGIGLVASLLGGLGVWRIVSPLRRLAATAARVSAGDLAVETGIRRSDEIGVLARTFDDMVARVRENVTSLGDRVRDRTRDLERANRDLERAADDDARNRAALAEAEARQRLILDAIPAAIAHLGPDECFRFANRAWSELVRKPKEAIVGSALAPIVGRRAYAALLPMLRRTIAEARTVAFEYVFTDRSGAGVVTANALIPEIGPDGATIGCFVLTRDVTDEKETERRIFEAEHLKAIGQLSGGLAHDFNNLLSIIIGNLATARERYVDVAGFSDYLEPAERAARRGADLTSRLLSFARRQPMRPEPVEVAGLLADVVVLLRRSFPMTVDLALEAEGDARDLWILADHAQLERAVVNLAFNARDALPPAGGRIRLVCRRSRFATPLAYDEPVPPGRWIEIAVVDTGSGFPKDAVARAFEPFFTTKSTGSGLGLAMVWGFVKQSHGYIRIASEPGRGATVSLLFAEIDATRAPDAWAEAAPSDGEALFPGGLALVVEDDDDVRRVTVEQMVGLGFSVIEAASGDEAASLVAGIDGIGVVVTDVVMPGLSGRDLARRIRTEHPHVAVVLVSGYVRDEIDPDLADVPLVAKPWEKTDLIAALARALGNRGEIHGTRPT